jgi:hypothetical protein
VAGNSQKWCLIVHQLAEMGEGVHPRLFDATAQFRVGHGCGMVSRSKTATMASPT